MNRPFVSAELGVNVKAQLLTKRDLAVYLGVTPRTVETYQRQGLPFFRLGLRRNRYDLAAVCRWLEARCVGS